MAHTEIREATHTIRHFEFANSLDPHFNDLHCSICTDTIYFRDLAYVHRVVHFQPGHEYTNLKSHRQTCGRLLCGVCTENLYAHCTPANRHLVVCPTCDQLLESNTRTTKSSFAPVSLYLTHVLESLAVLCKFCRSRSTAKDIDTHIECVCAVYSSRECLGKKFGCTVKGTHAELSEHDNSENECIFAVTRRQYDKYQNAKRRADEQLSRNKKNQRTQTHSDCEDSSETNDTDDCAQ